MSDESPTRRLSQIFGSLSCLSDLQKQEHLRQDSNSYTSTSHANSNLPKSKSQQKYVSTSTSTTSLPSTSNQGNTNNRLNVPLPPTPSSSSSSSSSAMTPLANPSQSVRLMIGSRSTPNSPRLMPKRQRAPPAIPQRPSAALIASPALAALDSEAPWPHFSSLTDHLDVRQVNNYTQGLPEINWQERCLELQLELHRTKSQASRIRDMLRDKVSNFYKFLV